VTTGTTAGPPAVYSADRVLTGEPGRVIEHGAVVVEGTTISWVGPIVQLPPRFGTARHRALAGSTILPGLVDAHVHLGLDSTTDPVDLMLGDTDDDQRQLMADNAGALLRAGVTTARDLGSRGDLGVELRDTVASGRIAGPRLVVAGPPLTSTGGHCWFMGGECGSVQAVRRTVRRLHLQGVDLVKVMVTGGFTTAGSAPSSAELGEAELCAAVDAAHERGLPVAAHAHATTGIRRALRAGVDTIEHCSFVEPDGAVRPDLALVEQIAASGTFVCPATTRSAVTLARLWGRDAVAPIALLHRNGVRLIAGSDAGIIHVEHARYVDALQAMVALGLPPEAVLQAATAEAASALGLGDLTGSLTVGRAADLLVVAGDPRHDLSALRNVRLVVSGGTVSAAHPS
jgi:imidazolonepropionase-like amidohydrolase